MSGVLRKVFGLDDNFVRPTPPRLWRADIAIALLLTVISAALVFSNREVEELVEYLPVVPSLVAIGAAGVLLSLRRRVPIGAMLALSGAHFIVCGVWLPMVASLASMQITYFLGIYTAMAYARRREALVGAMLLVYFSMAVWLILFDVYGRAFLPDDYQPTAWYYFATALINIAYFGGATWLGRNAWLQAKATHELAESNATVSRQADQLAEQAVVSERLRIARDLHDSVAHHISLIGIQTAAARRAMAVRPEAATEALLAVEEMSREAVSDLRSLLGSLRDDGPEASVTHSLEGVAALCRDASTDGLAVAYEFAGDEAEAHHLSPIQLATLVRVTQESLTNVRRHSTATEARVVVRISPSSLELEVTDNGRPVPATAGSGLGQVGMRERLNALGGSLEAGPRRAAQGYRVLARIRRSPQ